MGSRQARVRPLYLFLGVFIVFLAALGLPIFRWEQNHTAAISPTLMVIPLALILAIAAVMVLAIFQRPGGGA